MSGEIALPMLNPQAGRLGRLLESLPNVARASRLSSGRQDACPTGEPLPMTMDEARRRGTVDRFLNELDAVAAPASK